MRVMTEAATKITPATAGDLSTVHDLILAVGLSQDRESISATFEGSTYWIARQDGVPVGTVGLEHGEGASLLRSAAVLPQARGNGVGRALVQSAVTLATLRGDRALYLFSTGAGAYWQRHGFGEVPVGELAGALPQAPQVKSGQCQGWLGSEVAWRKDLEVY